MLTELPSMKVDPLNLRVYEPTHDKTNKMACVPSKDSDQPGHPPSKMQSSLSA